ncbi:unnamed protein product [Durusdinium trenchii]|uniref:Scavenger mRNA-decapping enzyme DcpS n=1 Tax=Durusdinium trenchii TaxID=1381693 RepID=A0ABP0P7D7_9DINO
MDIVGSMMDIKMKFKLLRHRCAAAFEWVGILPVTFITLAMLLLPTVMPRAILRVSFHQKAVAPDVSRRSTASSVLEAVRWYFEAGWLWKEDTAELSRRGLVSELLHCFTLIRQPSTDGKARLTCELPPSVCLHSAAGCDILYFAESHCSCADDIVAGIMEEARTETIYADKDWKVIKDPKMTANSMHYTAWSSHRELRTAAELHQRHVPLLRKLLREGIAAVLTAHPDLRSESEVAVFMHFPPNIFRLHVHFVPTNRTMWAPREEVIQLIPLLESLQEASPSPVLYPPTRRATFWHRPLSCKSWG